MFTPTYLSDMSALDSTFWDTSKNVYYYNYDSKTANKSGIAGGSGFVVVRKFGGGSTMQIILTQSYSVYVRSRSINEDVWTEWKKI